MASRRVVALKTSPSFSMLWAIQRSASFPALAMYIPAPIRFARRRTQRHQWLELMKDFWHFACHLRWLDFEDPWMSHTFLFGDASVIKKRGRRSRCRLSFPFCFVNLCLSLGSLKAVISHCLIHPFPMLSSAWIADPSVATPAQGKIRKRPVHGVANWLELRLARGWSNLNIYIFIE